MSDHDRDYKVGYGKPPKHTRFKPGQSGNPKGRPKRTKDLDKLIDKELSRTIRINENGRTCNVTIREAIIKTIAISAVKGDAKAFRMLLPFMGKQADLEDFKVDREAADMLEELINQYTTQTEDQHDTGS